MSWTPIHPNHAIERTRVVIQFATPLALKLISSLGSEVEKARSDFGFKEKENTTLHNFTVQPDAGSPIITESVAGWVFKRELEAGSVAEALVLDQRAFVYESLEYISWKLFQERFSRISDTIVQKISENADILAVTLEYYDVFTFDGPPDEALPGNLISENLNDALYESARNGAELWHLHRGWFEQANNRRILVNQNIGALPWKLPNQNDARRVQIFTKTERQANSGDIDLSSLRDELDTMHEVSKRVVSESLKREIGEKIGLGK